MENGLLYDKRVASGIMQLMDIVDDVFEICKLPASAKSPKRTTYTRDEYGYYLKNKKIETDIFFGIWYEAWEQFKTPMYITIDYKGNSLYQKLSQIKSWVEKHNFNGIEFKEFAQYGMLILQESFFNFENDAERMYKVLNDLNAFLEVQYEIDNP